VCAPAVVGFRRRFSRPADGGGNQGNPTHGACTGRAIGEEEGVPQPTAPGSSRPPSPIPRSLSRVRQRTAAGSSSVHFSRVGRECTDHTRDGASLPAPLPPPSQPLLSLYLPFPLYPSNSMCLFVYSRVLGNTRYASNGASYTRRAARGRLHSHSGVASGRFSDSSETSKSDRLVVLGFGTDRYSGTDASRPFSLQLPAPSAFSTFPQRRKSF